MHSVREFGDTCLLYSLDDVPRYGAMSLFHAEVYKESVINTFVHTLWVNGNAPMFAGFWDRIETWSRGHLPPKQTVEGFLPENCFQSISNCRICFFGYI